VAISWIYRGDQVERDIWLNAEDFLSGAEKMNEKGQQASNGKYQTEEFRSRFKANG